MKTISFLVFCILSVVLLCLVIPVVTAWKNRTYDYVKDKIHTVRNFSLRKIKPFSFWGCIHFILCIIFGFFTRSSDNEIVKLAYELFYLIGFIFFAILRTDKEGLVFKILYICILPMPFLTLGIESDSVSRHEIVNFNGLYPISTWIPVLFTSAHWSSTEFINPMLWGLAYREYTGVLYLYSVVCVYSWFILRIFGIKYSPLKYIFFLLIILEGFRLIGHMNSLYSLQLNLYSLLYQIIYLFVFGFTLISFYAGILQIRSIGEFRLFNLFFTLNMPFPVFTFFKVIIGEPKEGILCGGIYPFLSWFNVFTKGVDAEDYFNYNPVNTDPYIDNIDTIRNTFNPLKWSTISNDPLMGYVYILAVLCVFCLFNRINSRIFKRKYKHLLKDVT